MAAAAAKAVFPTARSSNELSKRGEAALTRPPSRPSLRGALIHMCSVSRSASYCLVPALAYFVISRSFGPLMSNYVHSLCIAIAAAVES